MSVERDVASPRPWVERDGAPIGRGIYAADGSWRHGGRDHVGYAFKREDAALIVRAVNAHDGLLKAAKCLAALTVPEDWHDDASVFAGSRGVINARQVRAARAAIRAAEGDES